MAHDRSLAVVNLVGIAVLLVGLGVMATSVDAGFDPSRALDGIVSQLDRTLWPAIAVALAVGLQVAAGASLVRIMRWSPYRSLGEAAIAGVVAAVGIDVLFLLGLGPFGLFHVLPIGLLLVGLAVAGLLVHPFFVPGAVRAPTPDLPAWLLVGAIWSAPLLLQLASPLVPFVDVLPNHVAPVEHLRAYGTWEALAVSPSPIYGPSRIFLGYVAMLGTTATLSGLEAGLAIAAFALPLTLLFAAAGRLLARTIAVQRLGGGMGAARERWTPVDDREAGSAAYWVLLTLPLTFAFLRLPDARATVLAFLPASLALVLILEPVGWAGRSRAVMLAVTLGAGVLVHPVIGLFMVATIVLIGLLSPTRLRAATAGSLGGLLLALPQLLLMSGAQASPLLALPAGLVGIVVAALIGSRAVRDDWSMPRAATPDPRLRPWLLGLVGAALLVLGAAVLVTSRPVSLADVPAAVLGGLLDWGVLLLPVIPFVLLVRARRAWLALGSTVLVGLVAGVTGQAVGLLASTDLLIAQSIAYEVPKSAGYLVPWALAIAGGLGLAASWAQRDLSDVVRVGVAGSFVVLAAVSLRPDLIEPEAIEQHRYAETLAISLRNAQDGYWVGHADARTIVDEPRRELIAAVRAEQAEGRLAAADQLLHVAPSFQQWVATPLGVFTGVIETTASEDPEDSIHTAGGRLRDVHQLAQLLGPPFDHVVVEGYPDDPYVDVVKEAGYEVIWRNDQAVLLRRGP